MFINRFKEAMIAGLLALTCYSTMQAGQPPAQLEPVPPIEKETSPPEKEDWSAKLFPEGTSRDFGAVPSGMLLLHPFRIVNNTAHTIHIANVRASMGPSTAWCGQYSLAPGQETAVFVQMNSHYFNGVRSQSIYVTLDEPVFAQVRLFVQANSRRDLTFTPQILDFAKIKRGATSTRQMTVTLPSHPKLEVTDVKCDSNYIQVKLRELVRGSEATFCQISATVRADIPEGKWHSDVKLYTSNPEMPCVQVPVRVEVEQ